MSASSTTSPRRTVRRSEPAARQASGLGQLEGQELAGSQVKASRNRLTARHDQFVAIDDQIALWRHAAERFGTVRMLAIKVSAARRSTRRRFRFRHPASKETHLRTATHRPQSRSCHHAEQGRLGWAKPKSDVHCPGSSARTARHETSRATGRLSAARQYRCPSSDPKKTRSFQATGANRTGPSVKNRHSCSPVSVSKAVTLSLRDEATNIVLPSTTGS